ncbi:Hsp70 family protein [Dactylosporangium sp. CA-092794]|uniref:Hsp70 family protein n=1 Tax=Dactylosporangium sp. CA-092794 TaxID=3239929 RepID=UPI003D8FA268
MDGRGYTLAVDFGTSSTVGVLRDAGGRVRPLLFDASPLLGSAVFVPAGGGAPLTGADAERAALSAPDGLEPNPKQRIDDGVVWLAEREVAVVELIAAVLERVVEEARRVAGGAVGAAVLTHPSSWRHLRKGVLVEAARRAGLPDVRLVAEPVAAAAYFTGGQRLAEGQCLVVYDLGAGTFDVSVVRRRGDGFVVLAEDGLGDVGGLYLDAAILDHVRAQAGAGHAGWAALDRPGTNPERRARYELLQSARAVKEQLSRRPTAGLHVPLVGVDVHVTREEFEALARPHLERTTALTRSVLRVVGVAAESLAGVFLVGGGSRVPLVATLLHRALRVAPTTLDLPELVVAEGALLAEAVAVKPARPETVPVKPARAETVTVEPARAETVSVKPARAETVTVEPARAETVPVEHARAETVPVEHARATAPPEEERDGLARAERLLRTPAARRDGESLLRTLLGDPDRAVARRARELWYGNGLGAVPGQRPATSRDPVIGIDLGTTNAAVGVLERGRVRMVPNAEGATTTPSVVAVTADGAALIGAAAARRAMTDPAGTVRGAKLLVGTGWSIERGGARYTADELLTLLLAKLHVDAETELGGPVHGAVLTVPASFDHGQRLALVGAARRAGLNVFRLLNEPTAAALAHGLQRGQEEIVLVFDLGGGTFDVSVVEVYDGVVEIKATAGDPGLGGDDWDRRIVAHLTSLIRQRYDLDVAGRPAALERLRDAAERAKVELSSAGSAEISLPYLGTTADGPVHVAETLTRAVFEELTRDLLERCGATVERVLRDAAVEMPSVDRVVLAGGASRMPAVGELVRELAGGRAPYRGLPPEGVVIGAALQAGVLAGEVKDVLLLDVTSLGLGFELAGGAMRTVIERNTSIPTRITVPVTTGADGQDSVLVRVVEGNHPAAAANRLLATLELSGLPPAPAGTPHIEICFDIDANGILDVSAADQRSRRRRSLTVDRTTVEAAGAPGPDRARLLPVPSPQADQE